MTNIKLIKMVIDYVLRMISRTEFTEMRYTLEVAKRLIDKLPDYQTETVITALMGGEDDAE